MPANEEENRDNRTRGERVRSAGRTLHHPRSASWVADETGVSTKTAQKYLDQLVEDSVLRKTDRGDQTLYCIDQLMAKYREVAELQRAHSREELTDALETMRNKITDWKQTYGVETPGELRASIADVEDTAESETRRDIAKEWEHLTNRIPVVRAALNEYDWADDPDPISA